MTQVLHVDKVVVRDAGGAISHLIETQRTEDAAVHAKCVAVAEAAAGRSVEELRTHTKRLGAELDALTIQASRDRARIRELEEALVAQHDAHESEKKANLEALAAAIERWDQRGPRNDAALLKTLTEVAEAAASMGKTYQLPTDLADLAALAQLEDEIRELAREKHDQIPARILWVVAREAA